MALQLPKFSKGLPSKGPGPSYNEEKVSRDNQSQSISDYGFM